MSVTFDPESWDKAGTAFGDDGAEFQSRGAAVLGGMDVPQRGSQEGGTVMDTVMSTLVPPLLQALTETANGIAGGLTATGEGLTQVAADYRAVEGANAQGGSQMVDPGEG